MNLETPQKSVLRLAAPALLLAAAVLLPFLGKAFTIDDTLFLLQAEHLLSDPLHPTAFEVVWTEVPHRLSSIMPSGPVMAYLLLPSMWLGGAEWAAHLVQLLLLWVAVLSTVSLGLQLGLSAKGARRSGLLIVATPAVLGMAATAMPDVTAMAMAGLGMERFVAWQKTRRRGAFIATALAFALGILTRSHLVLLVVVAGLYACGDRGRGQRRFWPLPLLALLPFGAGLLLAAAVLRLTRDPAAEAHSIWGAARQLSSIRFFPSNLVAFFSHWALSLPLALPWAIRRFPHLRLSALKYIIPVAALIIVLTTSPYTVWVAPIVGISALALYDIVQDARERQDHVQLVLAAWILLALPVAIYIHMPPKYLIASAPAMAILLSRRFLSQPPQAERALPALPQAKPPQPDTPMFRSLLLLGTLLGVLIIRADTRFAELGRRAARDLIAPRVKRGERVWFSGHWGFQFYALQAGARSLTETPPHPAPGDIVVASMHAEGHQLLESNLLPRRRLLESLADHTPGGRIQSHKDGAGFFSNGWGYLPWIYGKSEIERVDVWQIE